MGHSWIIKLSNIFKRKKDSKLTQVSSCVGSPSLKHRKKLIKKVNIFGGKNTHRSVLDKSEPATKQGISQNVADNEDYEDDFEEVEEKGAHKDILNLNIQPNNPKLVSVKRVLL